MRAAPPMSIREIGASLGAGDMTVTEIVEQCIAVADAADEHLGTYITRFDDAARAQAERLDLELQNGRSRGPLHGIPVAIKDLLATDDGPTTAQSLGWSTEWGERGDGAAVRRLRDAGMIVMGKTTTMEIASGLPTADDPFPLPRNPWDPRRWPGGSSSGSGSAVATGMAPAALGTDTGGSIRCPASLSGVTGFKPSFGLVPKSGCIPVGLTYDHVGPLARTTEDCAILTRTMAGWDAEDALSSKEDHRPADSMLNRDLRGVRIGVPRHLYEDSSGVEDSVRRAMAEALDVLATAGAVVVDISVPFWREVGDATMLGAVCEHYANFADELAEAWHRIGRSARVTLAIGALSSARDYAQAQRVRAYADDQMRSVWNGVDIIASPTTPRSALPLEDMSGIGAFPGFTSPWNGLGVPALSVPMRPDAEGLPQGLQLAGPYGHDAHVLSAGHSFQQSTSWHRAAPELGPPVQHDVSDRQDSARR